MGETIIEGPLYAPRKKVYPQAVHGRFRRIKWAILAVTLAIYYLLPFVRWDRGPGLPSQAVLVDLPHRRFYFFFIELWPQEVYYFTETREVRLSVQVPSAAMPKAPVDVDITITDTATSQSASARDHFVPSNR